MLFSTQRSFVPLLSVSKFFPISLLFRPEGAFPDLFPSLPSVSQPCLQQRGCAGAQRWTGCGFSLCFNKQTFTSNTSGSYEYIQILLEAGILKNWGRLICCSQIILSEVGCPGCSSKHKTLMVSTVTTGLKGTAGTGAETDPTCDMVRSSFCLANLLLLFCYYFGNKKNTIISIKDFESNMKLPPREQNANYSPRSATRFCGSAWMSAQKIWTSNYEEVWPQWFTFLSVCIWW